MLIKFIFAKKKGIVLIIVMGIMIAIVFLALGVSYVLSQQARVAEHKIKRMRAYYAAMAGVVYAFDKLRNGTNPDKASFKIGNGIYGYPSGGLKVKIAKKDNKGPDGTDKIDVTVDYSL